MEIPVKPRVLIADDSRIVRATLIKHIEGMFDFREALDGEQAWETLLVDPHIRVVITDLTMPKLDGYGLLHRIRTSRISRIRELPVVVVSGSDQSAERERAKAAGATDLITKGMDTAQLLSRLDILSRLVATQREFEQSLEALVRKVPAEAAIPLQSAEMLHTQADTLLASALKNKKNFVLFSIRIGLKHADLGLVAVAPAATVVDAVGQLLRRTIRQTDHVARTGDAEFTLATGGINGTAAHCFAQRMCQAIAGAHLVKDGPMSFIASCGLVSLCDDIVDRCQPDLATMHALARRRASLGLDCGYTGVIGREQEAALQRREALSSAATAQGADGVGTPGLATLVEWIRAGRQGEVMPHMASLPAELRALVELALQQNK